MSDVSPEDRERLVDIRFGELFDRHLDRRFAEVFDQRLMEWAELSSLNPHSSSTRTHSFTRPTPAMPQEQPQRRRSLFDISLAQALGLS